MIFKANQISIHSTNKSETHNRSLKALGSIRKAKKIYIKNKRYSTNNFLARRLVKKSIAVAVLKRANTKPDQSLEKAKPQTLPSFRESFSQTAIYLFRIRNNSLQTTKNIQSIIDETKENATEAVSNKQLDSTDEGMCEATGTSTEYTLSNEEFQQVMQDMQDMYMPDSH